MGGNALKHVGCRRYDAKEYYPIAEIVTNRLRSLLGVRCEYIPSYETKESFGDLDILVETDDLNVSEMNATVIDHFSVPRDHWVDNAGSLSFLFEQLQVDLIPTTRKFFDSSMNYYSYNDMSNLVGRLSKKIGIKYGHEGLSVVVRDDNRVNHIIETINIETTDGRDVILDILGIDNRRPVDLEDMYRMIASSKYFQKSIFLLDNRNAVSRIRDKKRAVYRGFLEWIEKTNPPDNFIHKNRHERDDYYALRQPFYSEIICRKWPWVEQRVNDAIEKFKLDVSFSEVYNGRVIGEFTGLEGKELGKFMAHMKSVYPFDSIMKQDWIDYPGQIEESVRIGLIEYRNS